MKNSSSLSARWLPVLLLSAAAFCSAWSLSYYQDQTRVTELGNLAWRHFLYALELKDDMETIDWSKNLESLENVRAFQLKVNSKVIAEGGNRSYLPTEAPSGTSFSLVSNWEFRTASQKDPQNPVEFLLVYHAWPGSLIWGLFAFTACFVSGISVQFLVSRPSLKEPLEDSNPHSAQARPFIKSTRPVASIPLQDEDPFILIDNNYLIQKVTQKAHELLKGEPALAPNGHLLDLSPDPLLIQAIERAEEGRLLKPFPAHPHLSVSLKPDPNGCLLLLESKNLSDTSQKR